MSTNQKPTPYPEGKERSKQASEIRKEADEIRKCRLSPDKDDCDKYDPLDIRHNGDESRYEPSYIANFTKGLQHNKYGVVDKEEDFKDFRKAINEEDGWEFEVTAADEEAYKSKVDGKKPGFRPWESPRAGHVYDLQGPDAGDVGMAPAPRLDSPELAVEMAEVYAAALLRDVPFSKIEKGEDEFISKDPAGNDKAVASAGDLIKLISEMQWFRGKKPSDKHERNRCEARFGMDEHGESTFKFLRGSTPGAKEGPFLSQFLLVGNKARDNGYDLDQGYIEYGTQVIDQRIDVHRVGVDFMTDWCSWLDVQNGADVKKAAEVENFRRFITTPRDLATYVHYDALYQAYLNACLIMMGLKIPFDSGLPEGNDHPTRDAFATFGGPHILSLLAEVATRTLKAVRRQKFNHHCRARPEAIGGLLTAYGNMQEGEFETSFGETGRKTIGDLHDALSGMLGHVNEHNKRQNDIRIKKARKVICNEPPPFDPFDQNLLLPMAFPEGSPMHPSYGAGHAIVAGACVTILKAFFGMYEDDGTTERTLPYAYEPSSDGKYLEPASTPNRSSLTVQGELNKLAANISIGRNMAGVHYYSDYYDSLRMGERTAVGILEEQMITYGEEASMTFETFDGEAVVLEVKPGLKPKLKYKGSEEELTREWWAMHVED